MALGGVLRAALRAGDWARAAAQSRRQARALRSFSPEFGSGRRTSAEDFLRSRGVDVPDRGYVPFEEMPSELGGGFGARSVMPDGRVAFRRDLGMEGPEQRITYNPDMLRPGYSDIVAPYEGGRVWPMFKSEFGDKFPAANYISPWVGRGPAPRAYVGNPYDDGFAGSMPTFMPESLAYGYGKGVFDSSVPTAFHGPFLRPWNY